MNTSYGVDTYRTHDLNIAMRTSSGDLIKMDFSNEHSTSFSHTKDENGSQTRASFSSMQSFNFSIQSNGIDAQDQKEIDEFMKIAQPFIDNFLKELGKDAPSSPVTKLARQIASIFEPNQERTINENNNVKKHIVKTFDKALDKLELPQEISHEDIISKLLKESQKLLEKTLKEFDNFNKSIYA
ncbi:MAG: hypothetical protein QM497_02285 [Sulfurimonas sp.]